MKTFLKNANLVRSGTSAVDERINPGTTDLIAWWNLDEASGTRADSHNSYDLTETGTLPYSANGIKNGCVDSERSGSHFISRNAFGTGLDWDSAATHGVTYFGWVNQDVVPVASQFDVNFYYGRDNSIYFMRLKSSADRNYPQAVMFAGTANATTMTATVDQWEVGVWHFCAVSIDPSIDTNNVRFYHQGTWYQESVPSLAYPANHSADQIRITMMPNGNSCNAQVDEVGLYHRALSKLELDWLYNHGLGRTYSELS